MRQYWKVTALFAVIAAIVLAFYVVRLVSAPESAIIAIERDRLARVVDLGRLEKYPFPPDEREEKLRLLEYRLAIAYNREEKPDAAIPVLRNLIEKLDAADPDRRRSSAFTDEARCYEALAESYEMKKDYTNAKRARDAGHELMAKAAESRKLELGREGKRMRSPAD